MRLVAVTGLGLACALGTDPDAVRSAIDEGKTALTQYDDLRNVLPIPGYGVTDVDCTPFLKRKKDRKLLPRAAELAMVAAAHALGPKEPEVGCFVGVGREPPDQASTGPALMAAANNGKLDPVRLAEFGIKLYPPLAPLRTLPNLVLAHVAIHLDFTGESGTRAGEEAAGIAALVEGFRAVSEGRADVVIAGGADSRTDVGSARDLCRMGLCHPGRGPGEGAGMLRLEPLDRAIARGATIYAVITDGSVAAEPLPEHAVRVPDAFEAALGACGSAAGPIAVVLSMVRGAGTVLAVEASGACAWISWDLPPPC